VAPMAEQAADYLQKRLKIGKQGELLSQTVDRYWGPHRAEVIGEVNLNLADGGRRDGLCVSEVAIATRKAYLDAGIQSKTGARYGVWKVPGGITRPCGLPTQ